MKFRAKFCGGCNPRYDRGKAYNTLKERLKEKGIDLELASEDEKATRRQIGRASCRERV